MQMDVVVAKYDKQKVNRFVMNWHGRIGVDKMIVNGLVSSNSFQDQSNLMNDREIVS